MAKNKMNAKQRHLKRQAEKLARALYEAGTTAPKAPKKTSARRRAEAEIREAQRAESALINQSSGDTAQMSKADLIDAVKQLHDIAYGRYYALMQQGTPNAATSIYETEFAGMNPEGMTVNALRATMAKLQKWLKRKDTGRKKAKRAQKKTLDYLKKHGFPNVTADDLDDFFDAYARFLEYHGYGSRYTAGRVAAFAGVYAEMENPLENMQDLLDKADKEMRREYERNNGADTFGGIELSPGNDVQSPDAPGIPAPGQKRTRPPRAPKQSAAGRQRKKQKKSARMATRKKRKGQRKKR